MTALLASILLISGARADDPRAAEAAHAERAHLKRLAAWSAVSVAGGSALMAARWQDPRLRHFGIQSAGWGLINAAIVAAAWSGAGREKTDAEIASAREFVWLNEGLDVGYVGVGVTMAILGRAAQRPGVEGAGWGVAVQGAGLLVLDSVLLAQYPSALPMGAADPSGSAIQQAAP
jgi:hypothetical protein